MSRLDRLTPSARRRLWVAGTALTALTAVATAAFSLRTTADVGAESPAAPVSAVVVK